jgi:hypothetical protein
MRAYVGTQWQDNAVAGLGSFNPVAVNTGPYCSITPNSTLVLPGVIPGLASQYIPPNYFLTTTFYAFANSGVTGGQVQPQILGPDGNYRDFGALVTFSGPGFILSVPVPTPILGAQFNIVTGVTGGSIYLQIDALLA